MPDFKTDLSKIAVAESQKPLAHCKSWYLYPESSSYWQRQLSWLHPWILPGIYSGRICSLLVLHRKRFNRFCRNGLHFCRTTSFSYWCFESMIFYFHGFKTINTQRPMLSMIKFWILFAVAVQCRSRFFLCDILSNICRATLWTPQQGSRSGGGRKHAFVNTLLRTWHRTQKMSTCCPPSWLTGCCGRSLRYPESGCQETQPESSESSEFWVPKGLF